MDQLSTSMDILSTTCEVLHARSASTANMAIGLLNVFDLESELDLAVASVHLQNECHRSKVASIEEQLKWILSTAVPAEPNLPDEEDIPRTEQVEDDQVQTEFENLRSQLLALGFTEQLDRNPQFDSLEQEIKGLEMKKRELRSDMRHYHDLPGSVQEARTVIANARASRTMSMNSGRIGWNDMLKDP